MRFASGGAQRVGMREPVLFGGEGNLLARLWVGCLDLLEPEPQQVGLLRPFSGARGQLAELGVKGAQLGEREQ